METSHSVSRLLERLDSIYEEAFFRDLHVDEAAQFLGLNRIETELLVAELLAKRWIEKRAETLDGGFRFRLTFDGKVSLDEEQRNHANERMRWELLSILASEYEHDTHALFDSIALARKLENSPNKVCFNLEIMDEMGWVEITSRPIGGGDATCLGVLKPEGYSHYKNPPPKVVFLSHAASDKEIASYLKHLIEAHFLGVTVFASSEDLSLGQNWPQEVHENLEAASMLLILATERGLARPWVWYETGAGWALNLPVIPCCLGVVQKSQLPHPFSQFQGLNLAEKEDMDSLTGELADHFGAPQSVPNLPSIVLELSDLESRISRNEASRGRSDPLDQRLRQIVERFQLVRIKPTIPSRAETEEFQVQEVSTDLVVVIKLSGGLRFSIPRNHIVDILPALPPDLPVIRLSGRLQWITPNETWRFEDQPPSIDPYGYSKPSSMQDGIAQQLCDRMQLSYEFRWTHQVHLPKLLSSGWVVVYDSDGRYFRIDNSPNILLLTAKPKS